MIELCVKRLKRLVFSPPTPAPTAGTEPSSDPFVVEVEFEAVSVTVEAESVSATAVTAAASVEDVAWLVTAAAVAGSMVVCVNKLSKLVLSLPAPTAGTAPSSVPLPVRVGCGGSITDAVSVSLAAAEFAGSVGACLRHRARGAEDE